MPEILRSPLSPRASPHWSLNGFQTFTVNSQTLFSKPSRYGHANVIPNFCPLRSPKRRTRFRILSSTVSDSDPDFGLISAAERSDGSIVFQFGNAREYETTVATVDNVDTDDVVVDDDNVATGLVNEDSEELNERTETPIEQASGDVETVLDGGSSVMDSISNVMLESTPPLLEETAAETEANDLSCSSSGVVAVSVEESGSSLEVETVLHEGSDSDIDENTNPTSVCENVVIADTVPSELESSPDTSDISDAPEVTNTAADCNDNGNDIAVTNMPTPTPAQESDHEKMSPTTFDGCVDADESETETPTKLGHNAPSTKEEEFGVAKADASSVEESPIPGVVESHSIEDPTREEISVEGFVLSSGAALLRNPSLGLTGGEDAYFIACENWLGVADGVGQWSLEGISDGLYARKLMETCERIVSHSEGPPANEPGVVLVRSVAETESPGSSTILVAHFDGRAFHVANIGDSGFKIIRNGAIFQQSSPVVHEFNFPLHVESGDDPSEHIEAYKINLDEGDVIVTATDGLFDNLYNHDIVSIVSKSLEAGVEPQVIAESLAGKAQELSRSSSRSPFADAAQAAGYAGYSGGKLDDVAVIVSLVQKKPTTSLEA